MSTQTPDKIRLRSKYVNHKVELEPPVMQYLPNGGHVVVKPTNMIRFEKGRAEVDAETFELLKAHSAFTGSSTAPRSIWEEIDPAAPRENGGVRVIDGALSASTMTDFKAPTSDWDTDTPANLRKRIAAGQVGDPQRALEYEMHHRKNALVMQSLVEAISPTEQEDTESEAPKRRGRPPKVAEAQLEDVAVPLPDDGKVT